MTYRIERKEHSSRWAEQVELLPILARDHRLPRPEPRQEPRHLPNALIVREGEIAIWTNRHTRDLPNLRRRGGTPIAGPTSLVAVANEGTCADDGRDDPRRRDAPDAEGRVGERARLKRGDVHAAVGTDCEPRRAPPRPEPRPATHTHPPGRPASSARAAGTPFPHSAPKLESVGNPPTWPQNVPSPTTVVMIPSRPTRRMRRVD